MLMDPPQPPTGDLHYTAIWLWKEVFESIHSICGIAFYISHRHVKVNKFYTAKVNGAKNIYNIHSFLFNLSVKKEFQNDV